MMKYQIFISIIFATQLCFSQAEKFAPKFQGMAIAGINLSQIEGDGAAGYKKLGFVGGAGASYQLAKRWAVTMEMLFAMKGSAEPNGEDNNLQPGQSFLYELNYVEIPVYGTIMDWEAEGKKGNYMKIRANVGFSYSYLMGGTLKLGGFNRPDDIYDIFSRHDINVIAGASFYLTEHWGIDFRYAFSMIPMNGKTNAQATQNNLLSLRGVYRF
jgi:Outer membrane protein beta-barrel domain